MYLVPVSEPGFATRTGALLSWVKVPLRAVVRQTLKLTTSSSVAVRHFSRTFLAFPVPRNDSMRAAVGHLVRVMGTSLLLLEFAPGLVCASSRTEYVPGGMGPPDASQPV